MEGTQRVGQETGLGATDRQGISRSQGDASVKTLGVAHGNERKTGLFLEASSPHQAFFNFVEESHRSLKSRF